MIVNIKDEEMMVGIYDEHKRQEKRKINHIRNFVEYRCKDRNEREELEKSPNLHFLDMRIRYYETKRSSKKSWLEKSKILKLILSILVSSIQPFFPSTLNRISQKDKNQDLIKIEDDIEEDQEASYNIEESKHICIIH